MSVVKPPITVIGTNGQNIWAGQGLAKKHAIVCHIMAGQLAGCDSWFSNPAAQASANYGVGKDGTIHQYVDPQGRDAPYANGLVNKPDAAVSALLVQLGHVNPNFWCVTPETNILRPDLTWTSAGELRVGDPIVGFDEEPNEGRRKLQRAFVSGTGRARAPVIELTLADGTRLRSTTNHRWIVRGSRKGSSSLNWMRADEIMRSMSSWKRHEPLTLARFFDCISPRRTYEAGFLSAAFDSEGSLSQNAGAYVMNLIFGQRLNALNDQVRRFLTDLGFSFYTWDQDYAAQRGHFGTGIFQTTKILGGRRAVVRFLAEMQPPRLLGKWKARLEAGDLPLQRIKAVPVVAAEQLFEREVVTLGSTSRTYIAEGFGSHNTVSIEHEGNSGDVLTPAQLAASAQLCAWLCETFSIPNDEGHILGHYEFDSVTRAHCPGWDWAGWLRYEAAIAAALAPADPTTALRAQLAAVTAERDALEAKIAAAQAALS